MKPRLLSLGLTCSLVAYLTVALFLGAEPVLACCSHISDGQTSGSWYGCLYKDYDLGYIWLGVRYSTAAYTVYGACATYTDCDCTYWNPLRFYGGMSAMYCQKTGNVCNGWWDAQDENGPYFSSCSSGACQKTGSYASVTHYYDDYLGYFGIDCSWPPPQSPVGLNRSINGAPSRLVWPHLPGLLNASLRLVAGPQESAGVEGPVKFETTPLPDGHVEARVTNLSELPMTALVLTSENTPLVSSVRYFYTIRWLDSVFGPHDRPIMPGETRMVKFGGPDPGPDLIRTVVTLRGALLADGTALGDQSWTDRLVQDRKSLYEHFSRALRVLTSARARSVPRDELIQTFTEMEAAELKPGQSPELQRGIRTAYGTVLANLRPLAAGAGKPIDFGAALDATIRVVTERLQILAASRPIITGGSEVEGNLP